ncbi:formate dehydrogenase accessory sulfurtransferase FdhD [Opitutales bacterium ASA1]|uniref:formate dehydrogenase accessory sulfurtransferase FdhD n=1 Tax=Congregicoccus parvus TaxID=3081749 RepID=UPI002B2F2D52|nr:formate dehydrogenase accessory sulfurtransferase FdhD [Opitutales bacterium ASA1]
MSKPDAEQPAPGAQPVSILRISLGETTSAEAVGDSVAAEEPLEIRVEGRPVAVVMRTPGHDEELAAGFLLSESVVRSPSDVFEISHCPSVSAGSEGNVIDVLLVHADRADLKRLTRHVFTSSSCGICGKGTIEAVHQRITPLAADEVRIDAAQLAGLPEAMRAHQKLFDATGGLHACALFTRDGRMLHLREDVGRHNAVDKVLGRALLDGLLPLSEHVLAVSGRVSFEIMQKALAARVPVVAAVSAPTSLAVRFAQESGQTLACFVRPGGLNLYAGSQRVRASADQAK